jgi:beta-lactamase class A
VSVLGGGAAITARLRKLGIDHVDIAEPELNIRARLQCPNVAVPSEGWTVAQVEQCTKPTSAKSLAAAQREVASAPNAATTDAIAELLRRLDQGGLLSDASRRWLLATLTGTTTGAHRIKGLLPPKTPVAHKTGTGDVPGLSIATNDAGIVTLSSGKRFVIAVFVAGSAASLADQERLIAELARTAWDTLNR